MQIYKTNMDAIFQEAESLKGEMRTGGDFKWFKPKLGDNEIRIFPPYSARGLICKPRKQHFNLQPENKICTCTSAMAEHGNQCWVCRAIAKLVQMYPGLDLGRQEASIQFIYNVIDRNDEDAGVQLYSATPTVYDWIIKKMKNPKIGDITDPVTGVDLLITKTETTGKNGGKQTKYTPSLMPQRSPLHENVDIMEEWLNKCFDLDKIFPIPTSEQVEEYKKASVAFYDFHVSRRSKDSDVFDGGSKKQSGFEPAKQDSGLFNGATGEKAVSESRPQVNTDDLRARMAERMKQASKDNTVVDVEKEKPVKQDTAVVPTETVKNLSKFPECYCGHDAPQPHSDGSYGPKKDLQKCTFCSEEIACESAKRSKGL